MFAAAAPSPLARHADEFAPSRRSAAAAAAAVAVVGRGGGGGTIERDRLTPASLFLGGGSLATVTSEKVELGEREWSGPKSNKNVQSPSRSRSPAHSLSRSFLYQLSPAYLTPSSISSSSSSSSSR